MNRNKQITLLKKVIDSNESPNIIIYGDDLVGKKYILYDLLKIGNAVFIEIYEKIIVSYQNIYKINIALLKYSNIQAFMKSFELLLQTKDFYSSTIFKRIIFTSFETCKPMIQNKLRVILEKYRHTTIFIITTNQFTKVIDPIKSRCLCIRIPALTDISNPNFDNNPYHSSVYSTYDSLEGYEVPLEKITKELFILFHKEYDDFQNKDITTLKQLANIVLKHNLSFKKLCYHLIGECSQISQWTFSRKAKFIETVANSEYLHTKSYKSLIHLESLLITLYYLTTNHYKIQCQDDE